MSKSLGNVIDPFELVKKYGTDPLRYYLLSEIVPTEDGDFSYEKFEKRYNADLAGGIGNLVARTIAMAIKLNPKSNLPASAMPKALQAGTLNSKWFGHAHHPELAEGQIQNSNLKKEIAKVNKSCKKNLDDFKFNKALKSIWELISFCDKYINEQKPWEGNKNALQVVSDILFALSEIATLLLPFLPDTSDKIKKAIKETRAEILFPRYEI